VSDPVVPRYGRCISCREPFSEANVYSEAGWLETRVSGLCEVCFDAIADIPATGLDDDEATGTDHEG
jgi:hypothetical protein